MKKWLLVLSVFVGFLSIVSGHDSVRLRDVEVLTLHQGQRTTGRRSAPVPQIQCVGGTASGAFQPKVVQCYNRGSDGTDIQWECKTDMSNDYRFGDVTVTCEGYNYPEDEYILRGSCGLEYTLDYTEQGARNRGQQQQHTGGAPPPYGFKQDYTAGNQHQKNPKKDGFSLGSLIPLAIVAFVIYGIYKSCIGGEHRPDGVRHSGLGGFPGGGGGPPPPGFRPDDAQPPPSYDETCGAGAQSRTYASHQRGPAAGLPRNPGAGFWTGLGLGGLGGYFFGNRQRGHGGYQQQQYGFRPTPTQFEQDTGFYDQPRNSWTSWFGGNTNTHTNTHTRPSANMSAGSSSSDSGTRTASGFGGTRRR